MTLPTASDSALTVEDTGRGEREDGDRKQRAKESADSAELECNAVRRLRRSVLAWKPATTNERLKLMIKDSKERTGR